MTVVDINSAIRPFWMPRLNTVRGIPEDGLQGWIIDQNYQIYQPTKSGEFSLYISNHNNLVRAFAFDCNRMASAAFESMYSIRRHEKIQKSTSWLIIQSYYAAFFGGHAILRMLGISCSQLESSHVNAVRRIAKLFSMDSGVALGDGLHECNYDHVTNELHFRKLNDRSHEGFWKIFLQALRKLSSNILASPGVTTNNQSVAVLLDDLCQALCHEGKHGGNWLSYMRNKVNYRHELSCWFPYRNTRGDFIDKIYTNSYKWQKDPTEIALIQKPGSDLNLFICTCNLIVGLCRTLILDMHSRCPTGDSYLSNGCLRLLNTVAA